MLREPELKPTQREEDDRFREEVDDLKAEVKELREEVERLRRKKPEPQTEKTAKADIEAVKSQFPEDLATLLTFEVEGKHIVIKPKESLGPIDRSRLVWEFSN